MKYRPAHMSHLFLAHLSKNNNCPHLVENLFKADCNGISIIVASHEMETAVYCIEGENTLELKPARKVMMQMSLF